MRGLGGMLLVVVGLWAATAVAAGSWVASAPAVTVAMAERTASSAPLISPAVELAGGQRIGSVSWQYRTPAGAPVRAWLCHAEECVRLAGPRGQTRALAGRAAQGPLHFRFALAEPRQRPVRVEGLQVIVNHQDS
ncbi:flagellar protein FlhE [Halomonas sp. NO4]|uniref:flagellar protein FlhE n=1 Tax=Halomonas sp. NO4 TaxID=2484813 RepID=UPI001F08E94C|nr:flagellar protein FlhE [Halomonas sp. NO4]